MASKQRLALILTGILLFQILKMKKRRAGISLPSDRDDRIGYAPLIYEERQPSYNTGV